MARKTRKRMSKNARDRAVIARLTRHSYRNRQPSKRLIARRQRNTIKGYYPNPSLRGFTSEIVRTGQVAAFGAAGALGLDVLYGKTAQYLPVALTGNEYGALATKAVGAVLLGMIGNKVLPGRGSQLATGAMTVIFHEAAKKALMANFPALGLSEYLAYAPESGPIVGQLSGYRDPSSFSTRPLETNTLDEYMEPAVF